MHHAGRDSNLTLDPFAADCRTHVRTPHLERDVPVMLGVTREIHDRHPAAPKLALDHEPVDEPLVTGLASQRVGELGHCIAWLALQFLADAFRVSLGVSQRGRTITTLGERAHESEYRTGLQRIDRGESAPPVRGGNIILSMFGLARETFQHTLRGLPESQPNAVDPMLE